MTTSVYNIKQINEFLNKEQAQDLKRFLIDKIQSLNSLDLIDEKQNSKEMIAIEVKAQKKAHKILKEILSQIIVWEQKQTEKDERDKYYSL